ARWHGDRQGSPAEDQGSSYLLLLPAARAAALHPRIQWLSVVPYAHNRLAHGRWIGQSDRHRPARTKLLERRPEEPDMVIDHEESIVNVGTAPRHDADLDGVHAVISFDLPQHTEELLPSLRSSILGRILAQHFGRREDLDGRVFLAHRQHEIADFF